jgi:hypothetical protein
MYVFIWPTWYLDMFSQPAHADLLGLAVATSTGLFVLIAAGQLPRRALAIAFAPIVALISVVAQRKGFDYHFHPVSAAVELQFLLVCVHCADTFLASPTVGRGPAGRLLPVIAAFALGLSTARDAQRSPNLKDVQLPRRFATASARSSDSYLSLFNNGSYARIDLAKGAQYLQDRVPPGRRVFLYGMDPYLLFLAKRLAATPYIYNYDLNATAALTGGGDLVPNAEQAATIETIIRAHSRDTAERLRARPPEALVFMDGLYWGPDGWADFKRQCSEAAAFVEGRYKEAARFGKVRIWLPKPAAR